MKKRKTGGPAPPPAKRGQRRRYEQEVDEKTGELLSMETRARRGRELTHLRSENESLRKERSEFLSKIETLSTQLDSITRNQSPEAFQENQILHREIALHAEFIAAFQSVLEEEATAETRAKNDLYAQGAEAANSFLLGLLSESVTWTKAAAPVGVEIPLLDLEFRFMFRSEVFGKKEGNQRLDLRIDAFVPHPATAESVQELFFRALCSASDMQRLYGASSAVNMFPIDRPNENTHLLYFRRTATAADEKDQFTIFICNRSVQTMTKSSLAPPSATDPIFGTAKAYMVAMNTSTLFPGDKDPAISIGANPHSSQSQAVPVSGMIVKGVITWDDEDSGGTRFVVIYSVPEDYKIINKLGFSDLVTRSVTSSSSSEGENGKKKKKKKSDPPQEDLEPTEIEEHHMSFKFAQVLVSVANEFKSMMAERPSVAASQKLPDV